MGEPSLTPERHRADSVRPVLVAHLAAGRGGTAQHLVERGMGVRAGGHSAATVPDIAMTPAPA